MKRLLVAMPGLTATFTGERGEVFMAELVATLPDLHRDELLPAHPSTWRLAWILGAAKNTLCLFPLTFLRRFLCPHQCQCAMRPTCALLVVSLCSAAVAAGGLLPEPAAPHALLRSRHRAYYDYYDAGWTLELELE